eukprot:EG_transcript_38387
MQFHMGVLVSIPKCPIPSTATRNISQHRTCLFHGRQAFECSQIFDPLFYLEQVFGNISCSFPELVEFCKSFEHDEQKHLYCAKAPPPCGSYLCNRHNVATLSTMCHAAANPKTHYLEVGIKQGVAMHPGMEVVKIVLMHKNQWPLLRTWVLYHAHLVGF